MRHLMRSSATKERENNMNITNIIAAATTWENATAFGISEERYLFAEQLLLDAGVPISRTARPDQADHIVERMENALAALLTNVAAVKDHALAHYTEGWDTVVECWTDEEIAAEIAGAKSAAAAIKRMGVIVDIIEDRRTENRAEALERRKIEKVMCGLVLDHLKVRDAFEQYVATCIKEHARDAFLKTGSPHWLDFKAGYLAAQSK
jgi:hypothetical protein